jgi:hypothetical protein
MAGLFESMGYPQASGLFGGLYNAFSSVANPEMAMKLRYMQEEERRNALREQGILNEPMMGQPTQAMPQQQMMPSPNNSPSSWQGGASPAIVPPAFHDPAAAGPPAAAQLMQGQTSQAQPQQMAQGVGPFGLTPAQERLRRLSGIPGPNQATYKAMFAQELGGDKSTDDTREYQFDLKTEGRYGQWKDQRSRAKAQNITVPIDMRGETKFDESMGKIQAERWGKYIDSGEAAEKRIVDITQMREISNRMGVTGVTANIKEGLGPYADALGIKIDGLSDIQAYNAIIQRLAPQQRVPGSGSTSDIEFRGFLKSMPAMSSHPEAREMTLNTMEALARDEMARGEIAGRLASKEINRTQAETELRALPDPMRGFTEWKRKNPDIYRRITTANRGEQPTRRDVAAEMMRRGIRP